MLHLAADLLPRLNPIRLSPGHLFRRVLIAVASCRISPPWQTAVSRPGEGQPGHVLWYGDQRGALTAPFYCAGGCRGWWSLAWPLLRRDNQLGALAALVHGGGCYRNCIRQVAHSGAGGHRSCGWQRPQGRVSRALSRRRRRRPALDEGRSGRRPSWTM